MIKGSYGIENHGIEPTKAVHWNLSVPQLVEAAVARREGELTSVGAFATLTGKRSGRSAGDKFIVKDAQTEETVAWGNINQPISTETFNALRHKTIKHLNTQELFVTDAWAGADEDHSLAVRVVGTKAWHSLFARQLLRRPEHRQQLVNVEPEFVILCAPDCLAEPSTDGTNSETYIAIDFTQKMVLIGGTHYAGEIKKSVFTILNYLLPDAGVFPMHCSANVGNHGDVALFFGLSGTGKTTLSADARRHLVGDDEHGWTEKGIFNFEGGCYAKCIHLSEEREPQIFNALRFGSVIENVVVDHESRDPDFESDKFTENTRAAYPIEFIDNAVLRGAVNRHPIAVIFLTCDAFGVLPPISILSTEQAMYHFLSGYTAKLGGTEAGMGKEPKATFSTCFGQPFLPRDPMVYANLLARKLEQHRTSCYLINTGWCAGPYGVGHRVDLAATRAMVSAALSGKLKDVETKEDPIFGLQIPTFVPGVNPELLLPKGTWADDAAYDAKAKDLAQRFVKNFQKFPQAPKEVRLAGPRVDAVAAGV